MTTIDATVARLTSRAWDIAINPDGFEAALRAALTEAQMVQPALTDIDALAKLYCGSYASPHHITFTVEGLRNMIQAAIAQPVQPPSKALSDAELCVLLVEIDPETKRLPSGFRRFARAIEAAHGIGAQE